MSLKDSRELVKEVCERADALGVSMVMMPVDDVRRLLAALSRVETVALTGSGMNVAIYSDDILKALR